MVAFTLRHVSTRWSKRRTVSIRAAGPPQGANYSPAGGSERSERGGRSSLRLGPENHLRAAEERDGFAVGVARHGRIPDLCSVAEMRGPRDARDDSIARRAEEVGLQL